MIFNYIYIGEESEYIYIYVHTYILLNIQDIVTIDIYRRKKKYKNIVKIIQQFHQ